MHRHFKTKFIRGSTFSMAGTLLMLVFHFLTLKVLAEHMALEDFGIFSLLMVFSQGFVIVSGLGMGLTLVKNISGDVDVQQQQQVVSSIVLARAILLALIGGLVCTVGHVVLPRLFGTAIVEFIILLPVMFCLATFRETLFNVLQGRQQFHWYAIIKSLSAATRLSAVLFLAHFERLGVHELVWVEIIASSVTVCMLLVVSRAMSLLRLSTVRRDTIRRLFRFSAPLYANDLFKYGYDGITVLLLGALLAPSSVALFTVAGRIPEALTRVLNSLLVVYFPSMSELMGSGRGAAGERLMNLVLVLISASLSLAALLTYFFKEEIVLTLFSDQYIQAAPVLAFMMLSLILSCTGRLLGSTSVASGNPSIPLRINMITSAINAVACLVLIPMWGVFGAVSAQFAASATAQLLYWYQLKNARLVIRAGEVLKPLALGLAIVTLYETSGWDHPLVRLALIALYCVLCWFLVPTVRRCCEDGFNYLAIRARRPSRAG